MTRVVVTQKIMNGMVPRDRTSHKPPLSYDHCMAHNCHPSQRDSLVA